MGKKQKLRAQEQADQMPLTRAQLIMREDILGATRNSAPMPLTAVDQEGRFMTTDPSQPPLFDDELDDETPEQHDSPLFAGDQSARDQQREAAHHAGLRTLDAIMAEALGIRSSPDVHAMALQIISDGPAMQLSFQQWAQVQSMIETGVRAGLQHGKSLGL